MPPATQPTCTPEEYLAFERASPYRHEYVDGSIRPRAPSNHNHNVIAMNLAGELHQQMRDRPCAVFVAAMRVKVPETGVYVYPDVLVVWGESEVEDEHEDTLLTATVVVEILSETTEAFDRGDKFFHYRRLGSLREYVLIAQREVRVERYVRQGESWVFSEVTDLDGSLTLDAIGCTIPLREIYDGVELPAPDE